MDYSKENYQSPSPEIAIWREHINAVVVERYRDIIIGYVADFGCNNGIMVQIISENPKVTQVIGFDINEDALKTARELFPNPKTSFHQFDLVNGEVHSKRNFFSAAYSFHTLEHIFPEDLPKFLNNIRQFLVPGAPIVFSIPYLHHHEDPNHTDFYTPDSLKTVLESSSFKTADVYLEGGDTGTIITGLFHAPTSYVDARSY